MALFWEFSPRSMCVGYVGGSACRFAPCGYALDVKNLLCGKNSNKKCFVI